MPENTLTYQERLSSLRKEISGEGIDGYIIPRTDEFQGEFLADYAQRLKWISGFTGSAGSAVILPEKAVVMSDGRYTLQLREEVDRSLFELEDITLISLGRWLKENAPEGSTIGYDVRLHTPGQIEDIEKYCKEGKIRLKPCERNLIDAIWYNQPQRPQGKIILFPDEIAGKSAVEKCDQIAAQIRTCNAKACLLSAGDSIGWLLNIRGTDIEYSPLCLSYVLLHEDGYVDWFIDPAKITNEIMEKSEGRLRVFGFDALEGRLNALLTQKEEVSIWLDRSSAPIWFEHVALKAGLNILDKADPCVMPKAIKTGTEQEAIRKAHIEDGVALTRFLKWIDENQNIDLEMDELSVEARLEKFRKEGKNYIEPSFPTIAGFAENGAIVHYRASEKSCKEIRGNGILLVDSGGQYRWGTTDITRTRSIGTPTQEMRENYTRVLKGHIAVASAVFPKETTGSGIDVRARKALREAGLDYAHGTGHGVGCYSCVHEAGTGISARIEKPFEPGMLVSNEPGYYKEGEYGIRIENLVLVKESDKHGYYCFETVSLAPFDPKLIVKDMLDNSEKEWLLKYLTTVKELLSEYLNDDERSWLASQINDSRP